jgi:hypothetical protein
MWAQHQMRSRAAFQPKGETAMSYSGSGGIQPLYGAVIRDKCKTADLDTLKAYKIVGHDLLKNHSGPDAADLKAALKDLDTTIAAKGKK